MTKLLINEAGDCIAKCTELQGEVAQATVDMMGLAANRCLESTVEQLEAIEVNKHLIEKVTLQLKALGVVPPGTHADAPPITKSRSVPGPYDDPGGTSFSSTTTLVSDVDSEGESPNSAIARKWLGEAIEERKMRQDVVFPHVEALVCHDQDDLTLVRTLQRHLKDRQRKRRDRLVKEGP